MRYNKVVLKLSGEALNNGNSGIVDFNYVLEVCNYITDFFNKGVKLSIVVGGGNIWRGRNNTYIDSDVSDKIGIMSTTINSMILNEAFKQLNVKSIVLNSLNFEDIVNKESSILIDELLDDTIVIFGGGTGKVGCSTDTAASLRAVQTSADAIIKLTNVNGVYDKDPNKYKDAKMYDVISYDDVIEKELGVMDIQSVKACKDNNIDIVVVNINRLNNLYDVISNNGECTIVS